MLTEFAGSRARYNAWLAALRNTHRKRVRIQVMTTSEDHLASLTPLFVTGDVTIDVTRDTTRVLSLQLFDPTSAISFDPDDGDHPIYMSRMLRVWSEIYVPSLGEWVGPPVFTGPVVDFARDGVLVTVTCESKERLALGELGHGRTWARKSRATDVIKALLRETGETRLGQIPDLTKTLPEKVTVTRMDSPWVQAVKIARSMDRVLFYDGYGRVQLRRRPGRPTLRIRTIDLAGDVQVARSPEKLVNRWIVLGAKPRGSKKRVRADVRLPKNHKASGQSLGRNGEPRWLIEQEENSKLKTNKDAKARAVHKRDRAISEELTRSVECLPFPHLEEFDMLTAVSPTAGAARLRVRAATIPLDLGTAMSIGSLKRIPLRGRHHAARMGAGKARRLERD